MRVLFYGALIFLFVGSVVHSESTPTFGLLYGTKDKDFLQFECAPISGEMVECNFTQVSLRKKSNDKDLKDKLSEIDKTLEGIQKELRKDTSCAHLTKGFDFILDNQPPKDPSQTEVFSRWNALSKAEQENTRRSIKVLKEVCENPNKQSVEKMIRVEHDIDSKKCNLWINVFKQKFKRNVGGVWVSNSEAGGTCGVINISTLERDGEIFWNYRTRKTVTAKNTDWGFGKTCGETLDETEQFYSWKQDMSPYRQCDYIDFGL